MEKEKAFTDLKAAREAKGMTLEDVFKKTRISTVNLEALERGDFHRLPPPVYTKNFIRLYARAVGIEEGPLLELYERHQKGAGPQAVEPEVKRPWPEESRRYLFLGASLLGLLAAGLFVYALFLYHESPRPTPPAEVSQPARQEQQAENAPSPGPAAEAPAPAAPPAAPKAAGELSLVITARELTWLRIREDGNPPYEALLKPGESMERRARDHFLLDVGNAGGISLTFQGKTLDNLGARGQVVHLRLPDNTRAP